MKLLSELSKKLFNFYNSNDSNNSNDLKNTKNTKNKFVTGSSVEGDYFRSKTNSHYFFIVDKDTPLNVISKGCVEFRDLGEICRLKEYDPLKHTILRLEVTKNKSYYLETYQAVAVDNPSFTVMNISLEEIISTLPPFQNIPLG